ncbi:MAG: hypothetical protein LBP36_03610 [Oscillospiraceae bacterium]|jgi:hypothetical protein|nr:hypothetical protein [Oscillospiraceae bacterium]
MKFKFRNITFAAIAFISMASAAPSGAISGDPSDPIRVRVYDVSQGFFPRQFFYEKIPNEEGINFDLQQGMGEGIQILIVARKFDFMFNFNKERFVNVIKILAVFSPYKPNEKEEGFHAVVWMDNLDGGGEKELREKILEFARGLRENSSSAMSESSLPPPVVREISPSLPAMSGSSLPPAASKISPSLPAVSGSSSRPALAAVKKGYFKAFLSLWKRGDDDTVGV